MKKNKKFLTALIKLIIKNTNVFSKIFCIELFIYTIYYLYSGLFKENKQKFK